jgi:hypothetical protein
MEERIFKEQGIRNEAEASGKVELYSSEIKTPRLKEGAD